MTEAKRMRYAFRTLEDPMIQIGLEGIAQINNDDSRPYMVVGGIATQSYVSQKECRPTADIDVLVGLPLNYEKFKKFVKPIYEFFADNRYSIDTKKHHLTFCMSIQNGEDKILIEFSRKNPKKFSECEKRIKRELEHARIKSLDVGKTIAYKVCSVEDIILPKLVRIVNRYKEEKEKEKFLRFYKEENLEKLLNEIEELREDAVYHIGNLYLANDLKKISDVYDIKLLYKKGGINLIYFLEASKDWRVIREKSKERDEIISYLLPGLVFEQYK